MDVDDDSVTPKVRRREMVISRSVRPLFLPALWAVVGERAEARAKAGG